MDGPALFRTMAEISIITNPDSEDTIPQRQVAMPFISSRNISDTIAQGAVAVPAK